MAQQTLLGKAAPPLTDAVVGTKGMMTPAWSRWFSLMPATLEAIPSVINTVVLGTQAASISATDFSGGSLRAGLYRASYHARITRAATTSSSLIVTLSWTDSGVAKNSAGAAITGNTTATTQSGSILIRIDKAAAVRYATTYVSVGATAMQYGLDLVLERIKE